MKTSKNYRLSPSTITYLNALKSEFEQNPAGKSWSETEIVEYAISELYHKYRSQILDREDRENGLRLDFKH